MPDFFHTIRNTLHEPEFTTKFHKYATIVWILLLIPSILFWKESILWIILMSVWANIAGHWSAYQASRAEQEQKKQNGNSSED